MTVRRRSKDENVSREAAKNAKDLFVPLCLSVSSNLPWWDRIPPY